MILMLGGKAELLGFVSCWRITTASLETNAVGCASFLSPGPIALLSMYTGQHETSKQPFSTNRPTSRHVALGIPATCLLNAGGRNA